MSVKKLSQIIGVVFLVLILGGAILGLFSSFRTYEKRRTSDQVQTLSEDNDVKVTTDNQEETPQEDK